MLRFLASQPDPVPLERIARACDLPRSTAYHLLGVMVEEGFVAHLAEDHRYGLGVAAFEVGSGYTRQEPLQRLATDGQLAVYNHDGFWKSIDTYREYLEINRMWDGGDRPWALWER